MALRIKQEDLAEFITDTLISIRAGIQAARDEGMIAEMPEKVDFTNIEVIQSLGTLENVVTTAVEGTSTKDGSKPEIVETTSKTGGGSTATETGQDVTTRESTSTGTDTKTGSGTDTTTTTGSETSTSSGSSTATKTETTTDTITGTSTQTNIGSVINNDAETTTKTYR